MHTPAFKAVLAFSALALAAFAAQASEALADKNACLNCHMVEKKMVGPSFKAVAAKYKGNANAVQAMAAKIRAGGSGVWGSIPMPPMAQVSEVDAKALATWLLDL